MRMLPLHFTPPGPLLSSARSLSVWLARLRIWQELGSALRRCTQSEMGLFYEPLAYVTPSLKRTVQGPVVLLLLQHAVLIAVRGKAPHMSLVEQVHRAPLPRRALLFHHHGCNKAVCISAGAEQPPGSRQVHGSHFCKAKGPVTLQQQVL